MASDGTHGQCEPSKPHVLVVPFASLLGHINPMMHLSNMLAARGVVITFAISQAYLHKRTLAREDNALHPNIRLVGVSDGLPYERSHTSDSALLMCQAMINMEAGLVDLLQGLHGPPSVSCIIADVLVVCASSVAKRFQIPHVPFWTQSAASYAAHVVATRCYSSIKDAIATSGFITCIPGCPALTKTELPTFLQPCDPSDFIFSYLTQCFENVVDVPHVLLSTFQDLESESVDFINERRNMCTIGPILPAEYVVGDGDDSDDGNGDGTGGGRIRRKGVKLGTSEWEEEEGCMAWLDKQEPSSVLYVSFGSSALVSGQQMAELAMGLEASRCPVLMVVRPAMMEGQEVEFPEGLSERMTATGRAMFVKWAPQLHILVHPSLGGFLTHCGWNSTLEAICNGLPMLCWPFFADQMMNCRFIVDTWKIGLDFDLHSQSAYGQLVSRHVIEEKVRYLMDLSTSAPMRHRAKKLSQAAQKSWLEDGGSSHLNLESFLAWLCESKTRSCKVSRFD